MAEGSSSKGPPAASAEIAKDGDKLRECDRSSQLNLAEKLKEAVIQREKIKRRRR